MSDDDEDFDGFDDDADSNADTDADQNMMSSRGNRFRKSWRDVERLREQREMDKLNNQDNWFDDLDRAL